MAEVRTSRHVIAIASACLLAGAWLALGCSNHSSCDSYSVDEPEIVVTNAATGAPVCDAVVHALEGDGGLAPGLPSGIAHRVDGGCVYNAPSATPGTYRIEVTAVGFTPGTIDDYTIVGVPCGAPDPVASAPVGLALSPSP